MKSIKLTVILGLILLAILPVSTLADDYDITYLGWANWAGQINDKCEIPWSDYDDQMVQYTGYWDSNGSIDLGEGEACCVNKNGIIGGMLFTNNGGSPHAAYWDKNGNSALLDSNTSYSWVSAINDKNEIAGQTYDWTSGDDTVYPTVWKINKNGDIRETKIPIPYGYIGLARDINNRGDTVGYYYSPYYHEDLMAFLWKDGELITLAPGQYADAWSINDKGEIAGLILVDDDFRAATFTPDGSYAFLSAPPGFTFVNGINNKGQIVGSIFAGDGLIWENGQTKSFGGDIMPGWTLTPFSINDRGDILCQGCDPNRQKAGWWLLTPKKGK